MGGAAKIHIETGAALPAGGWEWEQRDAPEAWPCIGPTWLRAVEAARPELEPAHVAARRGRDELAVLPAYVRAWRPGVGERCLVLGAPSGDRTEALFTFWTPQLFGMLVEAAVETARDLGVECVAARVPGRTGNEHLTETLRALGADVVPGPPDGYVPLVGGDERRLDPGVSPASGAAGALERAPEIESADVLEVADEIERAPTDALAAPGDSTPGVVASVLRALRDEGAALHAWRACAGDDVVGWSSAVEKGGRLHLVATYADPRLDDGERALTAALALHAAVDAARRTGCRFVEAGVDELGTLARHGCATRASATCSLSLDERVPPAGRGLPVTAPSLGADAR